MKKKIRFKGKFFLDSGAHSLFIKYALSKRVKKTVGKKELLAMVSETDHEFFNTDEFWNFVKSYGEFVNKYKDVIDFYTNVDVIHNPEITYQVQKVLETNYGLKPVPVVHFGTDLKWVKRYIDEGHDYLGVGGLGQGVTANAYTHWGDMLHELICPSPNYLPIVKTHGFAMTSFPLMKRWPWFSVDSATWTKVGGYGGIIVPFKKNGQFTYEEPPEILSISVESSEKKNSKKAYTGFDFELSGKNLQGRHYFFIEEKRKSEIDEWLNLLGLQLGEYEKDENGRARRDEKGKVIRITDGVVTFHADRKIANLLYFERFRATLPEWPSPFKRQKDNNPFMVGL